VAEQTFGENFLVRKHRKERILNGKRQGENWLANGTALGVISAGWVERRGKRRSDLEDFIYCKNIVR
jgi:hypothetical protein